MIGPVSGVGRSMMASLQQQMQKGMPVDQAIAYVKNMAQDGVAPLVDLYSMLNQFQRLKQQQTKPPQNPPTVRDQIDAMARNRQMGAQPAQMGTPQMLSQQPAPNMAPPPMEQGLGSMDAGAMENPSFAGGGIVAFDGGGTANSLDVEGIYSRGKPKGYGQFGALEMQTFGEQAGPEDLARLFAMALSKNDFDTASRLEPYMMQKGITQDEIANIRRMTGRGVKAVSAPGVLAEKVRTEFMTGQPTSVAAAPPAAPPAPAAQPERKIAKPLVAEKAAPIPEEKDVTEEQYKKLRDFRKREGLGAAREEFKKYITDEEKDLAAKYGRDRQLAFAEAGFRMAAAASRPGATFLGALAEGAISGTQALKAMNSALDANKRSLKDAMIKLNEAAELEKEGDYKAAMGLNKEARAEALELYKIRENLKNDRLKIAQTAETNEISREYTRAMQEERLEQNRVAMRERILSNSQYPMLEMQKQRATDPDEAAKLQSQMDALYKNASARAGLPAEEVIPLNKLPGMRPEDVTAASQGAYVPGRGYGP
jgi:hypothetical protein